MIRARGEPIAGRKSGERDVSEVLAREQVIWPDGAGPGESILRTVWDARTRQLVYRDDTGTAPGYSYNSSSRVLTLTGGGDE